MCIQKLMVCTTKNQCNKCKRIFLHNFVGKIMCVTYKIQDVGPGSMNAHFFVSILLALISPTPVYTWITS